MAQSAFIKRVGHAAFSEEDFVKLSLVGCADVADVIARACEAFPHWGAHAARVKLFLVPAGECDEPGAAAELAALSGERLLVGCSLEDARIAPGSWLLARVPPPPTAAAAPAGAFFSPSPTNGAPSARAGAPALTPPSNPSHLPSNLWCATRTTSRVYSL
jgi:hypothetical protein